MTPQSEEPTLRQRLHQQTAQIHWRELQRHFARGVVVVLRPGLDLINVAAQLAEDDADSIAALIEQKQLRPASDDDARQWQASDAVMWATVVAPWVIVQTEKNEQTSEVRSNGGK
jgi:hypothetical protein